MKQNKQNLIAKTKTKINNKKKTKTKEKLENILNKR